MSHLPYEIDFKVAGDTQYVAFLRNILFSITENIGEKEMPSDIVRKCSLALVEAVNNAVVHAHAGDINIPVLIKIVVDRDDVEMHVVDKGHGFDLHLAHLPDLSMVHGRGLYIIQALMDEVAYHRDEDENIMVMRCQKRKK
ncbi:ATP-binding protein [bacterium]|nr:ATP-binding protein [bacterium]